MSTFFYSKTTQVDLLAFEKMLIDAIADEYLCIDIIRTEDGRELIVDDFQLDAPKTKEMASILKALNVAGTALFATFGYNLNIYKSGRNIPGLQVLPMSDINALEVLKPKSVVVTRAALDAFRGTIAKKTA